MAAKKSVSKSVVSEVAKVETAAVVEKASKLELENVVKDLGNLQVKTQNGLAQISGELVAKINDLKDVKVAVANTELRLKELYNIEAEAVNLDAVRQEIAEERAAWEAEEVRLEEARDRREEEYNYNLKIKRRDEDDKVALNHKIREDALKLREADLKAREAEVADLRKQVDGIPLLVKKESDVAVSIATNSLKKTYEHEKALAAKDAENAAKSNEFAVQALKAQIEQYRLTVEDLKDQIANTQAFAKSTVDKAFDSTANINTLNAVQRTIETSNVPNNRK